MAKRNRYGLVNVIPAFSPILLRNPIPSRNPSIAKIFNMTQGMTISIPPKTGVSSKFLDFCANKKVL